MLCPYFNSPCIKSGCYGYEPADARPFNWPDPYTNAKCKVLDLEFEKGHEAWECEDTVILDDIEHKIRFVDQAGRQWTSKPYPESHHI